MGKVEAIKVEGLELLFYSHDPHMPPHFHAIRESEWNIRIYFLECTESHLEYDFKFKWLPRLEEIPKNYRKKLLQAVLDKRVELLEEYERKNADHNNKN